LDSQVIDNLVSVNISDTVTNELKQLMKSAQNNKLVIDGPVECAPGTSLVQNTQKICKSL
jgi:ABC-type thiamine transport system substrate-binding protein